MCQLYSAELPLAADGIGDKEVNLGSVEGPFAWLELVIQATLV